MYRAAALWLADCSFSIAHAADQVDQIEWRVIQMIHLSDASVLQIVGATVTQCSRIRDVHCMWYKHTDDPSEDGHQFVLFI